MIYHVSWPRSGCQLLIWCLLKYGSEDINYPFKKWNEERYKNFTHRRGSINQILRENLNSTIIHETKYLTYADLHDTPAGGFNPKPNFLHFHDVAWKLPKPDKYIFQHRHPILAAISHIGWGTNDEKIFDRRLIKYFEKEINKWKVWINKWIYTNKSKPYYLLEYSDFMNSPKKHLNELIKFLGIPASKDFTQQVLDTMNISYKHKYFKDFDIYRVYDNDLKRLEDSIKEDLNRLNIERIYS